MNSLSSSRIATIHDGTKDGAQPEHQIKRNVEQGRAVGGRKLPDPNGFITTDRKDNLMPILDLIRGADNPNEIFDQKYKNQDAFIESTRDINPPFYNYMKSKEAQVESDTTLIKDMGKAMETISSAIITALNEINPNHASLGAVTMTNSSDTDQEDTDDDASIPIIQKARNKINKTLRSFCALNPTLSDKRMTIGFCIKQFRAMAPPSEKSTRGRAVHATLHGKTVVDVDSTSSGDEDFRPRVKKRKVRADSTPTLTNAPSTLRDCVCGMAHRYADCYYLNHSKAPATWTPIVQIQSKVITAVKGSKRLQEKIKKNFDRNKIALPKFWPADTAKGQNEQATNHRASNTNATPAASRASYATSRFASSTISTDE